MDSRITSVSKEVVVGGNRATVLIGERINPTGKPKLAEALRSGNLDVVRSEAAAQVQAGADILDVNVGTAGIDEVSLLPQAVKAVMETTDAPLCLDSANLEALESALKVYRGKPLINSVSGEEHSLNKVLPLVKQYGAAVIGLVQDENGIPKDAEGRVSIARRIIGRAEAIGIPREDVVIDCLAVAVASDMNAGAVTLETIRRIRAELGANITLGGSNVSFGLPDRELLTNAFLAAAIFAGVTCPIVNTAKARSIVVAIDLILGHDEYGRRYIKAFRQRQQAGIKK
jgi:5-methyltetrahydrofolate--homocysteine methyltransferase